MTSCENCGAVLGPHRSIFKETAVCDNCGWWVFIRPATKMTVAAAITGFLVGVLEPFLHEPDVHQPA